MMKTHVNPDINTWEDLLQRPTIDNKNLYNTVEGVLNTISNDGDKALIDFTKKFDGVELNNIKLTEEELDEGANECPNELKEAIELAASNIIKFHSKQRFESNKIETTPGVYCWQKSVAIDKVGLYIPGGSAPLFSTVLMLGLPAKIAGCKEIVLCTPPSIDGKINNAILYAAKLVGIDTIYKLGGIQAIGAMAYGTESVSKVDKIFGPGNQYVMAAKQLVSISQCAIDMPAGPSEVAILADQTSIPAFIAADLLSQAEHGPDSQVILITNSEEIVTAVNIELEAQIKELPRQDIAQKALQKSLAIVLNSTKSMIDICNFYAPEHLIIMMKDYLHIADEIINAGSVFLGNYSPESAGDYASGTNHTLPTNGWARSYSGVNLDSFCKKITFQEVSKNGLKSIGSTIEIMAEAELLYAHKNAVSLRNNYKK